MTPEPIFLGPALKVGVVDQNQIHIPIGQPTPMVMVPHMGHIQTPHQSQHKHGHKVEDKLLQVIVRVLQQEGQEIVLV